MKEKIKDISLILFLSIVLRILPFIFYLFNPDYIFNNSITPYFYKFDSWYYAGIIDLPKFFIFILPFMLSISSLVYIYLIMDELNITRKLKFFGCMLISISPFFFFQTLIGYVDTVSIILFSTSVLIYTMVRFFNKNIMWCDYVNIITFSLLLFLTWDGYIYVYSIILVGYFTTLIVDNIENKKRIFLYTGIFIVAITPIISYCLHKLNQILILKSYGVGEYEPNLSVGYWVIFLLTLLLTFKLKSEIFSKFRIKIYMFFFITTIYTSLTTLIIQRFASISIIFMVIYLCLLLKNIKFKPLYSLYPLLLILLLFPTLLTLDNYKPIVNDELYDAISVVNNDNNSIISLWEYGHLINYIDNMNNEVLNRATPLSSSKITLLNLHTPEQDAVKYYDAISKTEQYYIIFDDYQFNKFQDTSNREISQDSIMIKIRTNKPLEYYNILSKVRLYERYFYILERR